MTGYYVECDPRFNKMMLWGIVSIAQDWYTNSQWFKHHDGYEHLMKRLRIIEEL